MKKKDLLLLRITLFEFWGNGLNQLFNKEHRKLKFQKFIMFYLTLNILLLLMELKALRGDTNLKKKMLNIITSDRKKLWKI